MKTLDEVACYWGTDKASWGHNYTALYEPVMRSARNEPIKLLELGWGSGCSAAMWLEYFPNATVVIIDNEYAPGWPPERPGWVEPTPEPSSLYWDNPRLFRYLSDQAAPEVVEQITDKHGLFDFIIDDASHARDKTTESFTLLWPLVRSSGYYIIEDIEYTDLAEITRLLFTVADTARIRITPSFHPTVQDLSIACVRKAEHEDS